jgi:hypothetical protein
MSSKTLSATALYDLIEAGEMGAFQMHEADLTTLHPEHKITPLHMMIGTLVRNAGSGWNCKAREASIMETVQWMLDRGADPREEAPRGSPFVLSLVKHVVVRNYDVGYAYDEDGFAYDDSEGPEMEEVAVQFAFGDRSAVAATAALMTQMRDERFQIGSTLGLQWQKELLVLGELMKKFTAACATLHREKVPVDESVVELWEALLADEQSKDVSFVPEQSPESGGAEASGAGAGAGGGEGADNAQAEQQVLTAHSHVLSLASPVLKAMLSGSMQEAQQGRIPVPDCAAGGVALFLQLLYTGALLAVMRPPAPAPPHPRSGDVDTHSAAPSVHQAPALGTSGTSTHWPRCAWLTDGRRAPPASHSSALPSTYAAASLPCLVDGVVKMLGGALPSLLDANSFGEIAEAAIVLELVPLKAACVSFAKGSEAVQQKLRGKKLPVAVRELLTPGRSSAPTAPQGKRRKVL